MACWLAFLIVVVSVNGVTEFTVSRLIQYEYEGQQFGSQVASLNFLGAHVSKIEEIPRRLVMAMLNEVNEQEISSLISQKASALLIVLPEKSTLSSVSEQMALWRDLEIYLGTQVFNIPIYFTYEADPVMSVYRDLEAGTSEAEENQLQFVVNTDEKIPLKQLDFENYYGFIYAYEESLPIIALVTHYDAFSILPDETIGMDENGSGVIALMEIARTFFKIYAQKFPNYNLMILITQAGTLNFDGARQWLQSEDPELLQIISKISFALCLDSLSGEGELNAHISRHPKTEEPEVTRFYQVMNTTSTLTGFPLNYQKKKINIADPFVPWQHENFSRRRIISATLSNREIPYTKLLDHGSVFDIPLNMTTLENNIRFITEALIRFLYDYKEDDALILYEKSDLVNKTRMAEVQERLTQVSRFPTLMTPQADITKEIYANFSQYTETFNRKDFQLEEYTLYSSKHETMQVYKVKPAILDFYFFIGVLSYVGGVWAFVKYFSGIRLTPRKVKSN